MGLVCRSTKDWNTLGLLADDPNKMMQMFKGVRLQTVNNQVGIDTSELRLKERALAR